MKLRLTDDDEHDDPLLSLVNLIDVFLIIIAALLLAVARNPLQALMGEDLTVIKNPGRPDMMVLIKHGEKIERYKPGTEGGGGRGGTKAGTAWRLEDGSIVYVPE